VLAERGGLEFTPELDAPPRVLIARVHVDRLVLAAVDVRRGLLVALDVVVADPHRTWNRRLVDGGAEDLAVVRIVLGLADGDGLDTHAPPGEKRTGARATLFDRVPPRGDRAQE